MADHKQYIVSKTIEALERFTSTEELETLPKEPGQPSVAPDGSPVFDTNLMQNLEFHRSKAINAPDFEAFMALLENIATEEGLNPAKDLEKLASVLNRWRVEKGLDPL